MKMKIRTKLLLTFLVIAATPLGIAASLGYLNAVDMHRLATDANQGIAALVMSDSMKTLCQEEVLNLEYRVAHVADDIKHDLTWVQADCAELADFATYLYENKSTVGAYAYPSTYKRGPNNTYGNLEENSASWLMVSNLGTEPDGSIRPALMEEIRLTEFMDIKFKSIAATNPYAVQLYINTSSQITRGMPFLNGEYQWINAVEQFPADMDLKAFDFYYLADEAHNPERTPVWTELYWDPAGLGWMISCIAPVYEDDELKGVVGIDVTLDALVTDILNYQIEETGFVFLMSNHCQALAFPERAADLLGFEGDLAGDFGNNERFSFSLMEANDEAFQRIIAKMQNGEYGVETYTKGGKEHYFVFAPVKLAGWSVGIVVPVHEITAPAIVTNAKIEANMMAASEDIDESSSKLIEMYLLIVGAIVVCIIPSSLIISGRISGPIKMLDIGSRKIGGGDLSHRIRIESGDEIEDLANAFNTMADDLEYKIGEIEAANEDLKELDKLKSQFISMASHELRTPLIAIQGYTDLIKEGSAGEINAEQERMLNTVSRHTARLERIVAELLDLSRIEENKLALNKQPFSIKQVIEEIAIEQQPTLDKRRHVLSLNIQDAIPPIIGDRDRISQVIINLLGNAIKYTPDGGYIRITAEMEERGIHLCVIDNGIGIKAEHIDKIFNRFYEVGDVTKHSTGKDAFMGGGTGLGLSIVDGIVRAHSGRIWVESEYGKGSVFHVLLPISPPEMMPQPEEPESLKYAELERAKQERTMPESNGGMKILFIDDDDNSIEIAHRMLAERYEVTEAKTSSLGLKKAIALNPDLILLSALMPGISGYDVCRILKGNINTKQIPVILSVASATAQAGDEQRAYTSGADGHITKPFREDDLMGLIESFGVIRSGRDR